MTRPARFLRIALLSALLLAPSLAVAPGTPAAPPPVDTTAWRDELVLHKAVTRWRGPILRAARVGGIREGTIGFAVIDHKGRLLGGRKLHRTFASASVFKSMLLVCYLNDPEVRDRPLHSWERSQLSDMIRKSANAPANWLYGRVSHRCLHRLARAVDMRGFRTEPTWGRTRITPAGTARLFFTIDRRIVTRHRAFAMRQLRSVVPSQRWGLPTAVPRGMTIAFKGGFAGSPGGGRTVSQGALFTAPSGHRFAIAVLTNHSPSQAYGERTLERIGHILLDGYRVPVPPASQA